MAGGAPSPPASLSVQLNHTSELVLDIGYPLHDGSHPVTHYRVRIAGAEAPQSELLLRSLPLAGMVPRGLMPAGRLSSSTFLEHRLVLSGLSWLDRPLLVAVSAQGIMGSSEEVTRQVSVPGPVRDLALEGAGEESLRVLLRPPTQSHGSPVVAFRLEYGILLGAERALRVSVQVNMCARCVQGVCTPSFHYECRCHAGFAGRDCNRCADGHFAYPTCTPCSAATNCSGQGVCDAAGRCRCNPGFTGEQCDRCLAHHHGPGCRFCKARSSCSSRGLCNASSGACECFTGYRGHQCATLCDDAERCSGHGHCNSGGDGCECAPGFGGDRCDAVQGLRTELLSASGFHVLPSFT